MTRQRDLHRPAGLAGAETQTATLGVLARSTRTPGRAPAAAASSRADVPGHGGPDHGGHAGQGFNFALERMVTVMVIACPHALGLAVPLVVAVSTALAATRGLLIRDRRLRHRLGGASR